MKAARTLLMLAGLVFPGAAFAGWGAIAYNPATGALSEAHGYLNLGSAENAALGYCGAGCTIINWEHNSCIALATNASGGWGEAHGYANKLAVTRAAVSFCGTGCVWREWACG